MADAGAFKAHADQVDATLYNARVGAEFCPWQNWGIVTQYVFNKIDADVSRPRLSGNVTFKFNGLQVLFKARF